MTTSNAGSRLHVNHAERVCSNPRWACSQNTAFCSNCWHLSYCLYLTESHYIPPTFFLSSGIFSRWKKTLPGKSTQLLTMPVQVSTSPLTSSMKKKKYPWNLVQSSCIWRGETGCVHSYNHTLCWAQTISFKYKKQKQLFHCLVMLHNYARLCNSARWRVRLPSQKLLQLRKGL